jgi:acyl-CoA thioester hydrolase
MEQQQYEVIMEVRDYECDMADGVNNSVYFNYLEHGRLTALKSGGVVFAELARQKIGLVTIRIEIDYIHSLVSGDSFIVKTRIQRISRLRFEFIQEINRLPDNKLILKATSIGTAVDGNGRPKLSNELQEMFDKICRRNEATMN